MFRTGDFKASKRLYAVDLASLRDHSSGFGGQYRVSAVWFRRKAGVTAACAGDLWDGQDARPVDALDFLAKFTDGRYGGDCKARWDGSNLWCLEDEGQRAAYLAVLRPMLEAYPKIPDGYSGWWHFG
jgi:hypothetical protein